MLSQTLDTGTPIVAMAAPRTTPPDRPPLLVSTVEARRQLGGIGSTAFYDAVKRHGIRLVRLGGRSLVPMSEIERIVAELQAAEQPTDTAEKAKALAVKSVAVRRSRRGSAS